LSGRITPEEITSKAHNIWLGISLGNKYFTKENIEKYLMMQRKK
jgi:hypothetical protein